MFLLSKFLKFFEIQKWSFVVVQPVEKRFFIFSNFPFLHLSEAFRQLQALLIPILYESRIIQCLKRVVNSIFLYFLRGF